MFVLLVMGRIKISNKELVSESALYIHKQTWKKERLKKKSKIKNVAETRDYLLFIIQSFWMRVSGKCKKRDKTFCAETRDYSELERELSGFEPGTFRSSV